MTKSDQIRAFCLNTPTTHVDEIKLNVKSCRSWSRSNIKKVFKSDERFHVQGNMVYKTEDHVLTLSL